jgi:hypothetical protein
LRKTKRASRIILSPLFADNKNVKRFFFLLLLCFAAAGLIAQESPAAGEPPAQRAAPRSLPREFSGISLGEGLASVKEKLTGNTYFFFRGDPDVSFLPLKTQTLIDCEGTGYIRRALFQFSPEKLYIMTLYFNPERMDYFSLFTSLSEKYGLPEIITPEGAVWKSGATRLALEKPLALKYIDEETFAAMRAANEGAKSLQETSRRGFLDSF